MWKLGGTTRNNPTLLQNNATVTSSSLDNNVSPGIFFCPPRYQPCAKQRIRNHIPRLPENSRKKIPPPVPVRIVFVFRREWKSDKNATIVCSFNTTLPVSVQRRRTWPPCSWMRPSRRKVVESGQWGGTRARAGARCSQQSAL